ncbi:hypothetical protein [Kineococcus aurantiacus]|uniref:Uncharacterized protein n=1 Tax=Kineococcus aurantiacus TaxID=37633 RepID=A0A7Y9J0C1_9ACTN|nr:hypothetical protein [Kineococcus aurantiacus]NYD22205.1 hypothetical protein [Kineococcus aurantiacus]
MRFNPPPNWPHVNTAWIPPADWQPEPEWGPVPAGWPLLVQDEAGTGRRAGALAVGALAGFVAGALLVLALDLVGVALLGDGATGLPGLGRALACGAAVAGAVLNVRACRRRAADRAARVIALAWSRVPR